MPELLGLACGGVIWAAVVLHSLPVPVRAVAGVAAALVVVGLVAAKRAVLAVAGGGLLIGWAAHDDLGLRWLLWIFCGLGSVAYVIQRLRMATLATLDDHGIRLAPGYITSRHGWFVPWSAVRGLITGRVEIWPAIIVPSTWRPFRQGYLAIALQDGPPAKFQAWHVQIGLDLAKYGINVADKDLVPWVPIPRGLRRQLGALIQEARRRRPDLEVVDVRGGAARDEMDRTLLNPDNLREPYTSALSEYAPMHATSLEAQLQEHRKATADEWSLIEPAARRGGFVVEYGFEADLEEPIKTLAAAVRATTHDDVSVVRKVDANEVFWQLGGRTKQMPSDTTAMQDWVASMVQLGFDQRCRFEGWTLAVRRRR